MAARNQNAGAHVRAKEDRNLEVRMHRGIVRISRAAWSVKTQLVRMRPLIVRSSVV